MGVAADATAEAVRLLHRKNNIQLLHVLAEHRYVLRTLKNQVVFSTKGETIHVAFEAVFRQRQHG